MANKSTKKRFGMNLIFNKLGFLLNPIVLIICVVLVIVLGTLLYFNYSKEGKLILRDKHIKLVVGSEAQLNYIVETDKGRMVEVNFTSENPNIVSSTKDGRLKAKRAGLTNIIGRTKGGQMVEVPVTVSTKNDYTIDKSAIYLTFNGGPEPEATLKILEILDKYNAKATFFVQGENARINEKIVKSEFDKGHTIGIYCNKEDYAVIYENEESYLKDFHKAESVIKKITGKKPNYWRFPGSKNNSLMSKKMRESIMDKLNHEGYTEIDYTATIDDSVGKSLTYEEKAKKGLASINDAIKSSYVPVVMLFDTTQKANNPEALEIMLKELTEKGYKFYGLKDFRGPEDLNGNIRGN